MRLHKTNLRLSQTSADSADFSAKNFAGSAIFLLYFTISINVSNTKLFPLPHIPFNAKQVDTLLSEIFSITRNRLSTNLSLFKTSSFFHSVYLNFSISVHFLLTNLFLLQDVLQITCCSYLHKQPCITHISKYLPCPSILQS